MSEKDIAKRIADHAALQSENAVLREEPAQMQKRDAASAVRKCRRSVKKRRMIELPFGQFVLIQTPAHKCMVSQ